eukprot:g41305.t1
MLGLFAWLRTLVFVRLSSQHIGRILRRQRWWYCSSALRCVLETVHISEPYRRVAEGCASTLEAVLDRFINSCFGQQDTPELHSCGEIVGGEVKHCSELDREQYWGNDTALFDTGLNGEWVNGGAICHYHDFHVIVEQVKDGDKLH